MHHDLDLSRLVRRKPSIDTATCLRYDWKTSHSTYATKSWARDQHKYDLGHIGCLSVVPYGNGFKISLGYSVDWSGTMYEAWEDYSSGPNSIVEKDVSTQSLRDAQVEAEKLYAMHMVPLLNHYDAEDEFRIRRLFGTY